MFLRFVYTIFIGILLATFVGVGIAAFYPTPKMPEYPSTLKIRPEYPADPATQSGQMLQEQEKYDRSFQQWQQKDKEYSRNVSIIALIAAVIIVTVSLTVVQKNVLIADGLLLGGLLTLIYSIVRGFGSEDSMFRFFVVAVGLVIALLIGYLKIPKPDIKPHKK